MPGPPPIPTNLKRQRGNPGQRRLNDREPQPTPTTAAPPAALTAAERALWEAHAPELVRLGLLTELDRQELAKYCRLEAAGQAGLTAGQKLTTALQMLTQATSIARYFGMAGPGSRVRLTAGDPPARSKWAGLIGTAKSA